ncbi:glycosyltransferase [Aeromonas caviae]|uniref:glycosyltransferase family 2 protein n=1 Tax=Aeromonas caviae TaxID=648 RepID=UPI00330569DA
MNITVCILSYNSERYIIECLNSVLQQTYDLKKIALYVLDDFSSDDSVSLVNAWIKKNKDFFGDVRLLLSSRNNGTVANANRAFDVISTSWVKFIAADDVLFSNALCDFNDFVNGYSCDDCVAIASQYKTFSHQTDSPSLTLPDRYTKKILELWEDNRFNQAIYLLRLGGGNFAPSVFLNVRNFIDNRVFCSEYDVLEDLPTWDKLISNHAKFKYMPITTVGYRIHSGQTVGRILGKRIGSDLEIYAKSIRGSRGIVNVLASYNRRYNIYVGRLYIKVNWLRTLLVYVSPINILVKLLK